MNFLGFLAIMKSKKFEYYNSDRCVYIEGNSALELEEKCSRSLGYLPKYTDIVKPQENGKKALKPGYFGDIRDFSGFRKTWFIVRKLLDYLILRLSTMPPVDTRQTDNNKLVDHNDEKFVEYK